MPSPNEFSAVTIRCQSVGTHAVAVCGEGEGHPDVYPPMRQTWAGIAAAYGTYTSPLRPAREDLEIVERAAGHWSRGHPNSAMRALLLGATPGIATLRWPTGATLLAVDSSLPVIQAIWPGNVRSRRLAACGSWLAMPIRSRSCDFVTGDGSFNALRYPEDWHTAAAAMHDVLRDGGMLVTRCYVRLDQPETPDDVIRELLGRGIRDINHFKFRLFVAMQRSVEAGAAVRDTYCFLRDHVSDDVLREMPGWSRAAVDGFSFWRDADTVYTFPTVSEINRVFTHYLRYRAACVPTYALGTSCPTLSFVRE